MQHNIYIHHIIYLNVPLIAFVCSTRIKYTHTAAGECAHLQDESLNSPALGPLEDAEVEQLGGGLGETDGTLSANQTQLLSVRHGFLWRQLASL